MREVYWAHDTELNRDVALKVLPDSFASDPDRLARFTREAQTLASLNHPHIAHAGRLPAERFEMIAHQLEQGALLGLARSIAGGRNRHAATRRNPRTRRLYAVESAGYRTTRRS